MDDKLFLNASALRSDKNRVEQVQKLQAKTKIVGRITLRPGLSLFEYNANTGVTKKMELKREVTFDPKNIHATGGRMKVMQQPGCVYVVALNLKNAVRKLVKNGFPAKM